VVSVNYGLVPRYSILDQIENAKCAVRFLGLTHPFRYRSEPDRIIGERRGHLAAVLGQRIELPDWTASVFYGPIKQRWNGGGLLRPDRLRALLMGYPPIVLQS